MGMKIQLSLLMLVTIGSMVLESVNCTIHIVGDKTGWNLPSEEGFFDNWAKQNTFVVGDELLFEYLPGLNTVAMVDKDDYGNCTTNNVQRTFFMGNSTVPLNRTGDYYFFSSVGKHCEHGQKLHVTVTDAPNPNH